MSTHWPSIDLRVLTVGVLAALASACPGAQALRGEGGESKPLDRRIDPSKITELAPTPLPEKLLQPLPPEHRIADNAGLVPIDGEHWARATAAIEKGLAALVAMQDARGAWLAGAKASPTPGATPEGAAAAPAAGGAAPVDVAVTALAVKAIAQASNSSGGDARAESLRRGLQFIRGSRSEDGAFGAGDLANYVTSSVVSALSTVDEFAFHDELRDGTAWLENAQWDESEGLRPEQDWYGGAGYGNRGRPDLSNTQLMLDALYDAGVSPDEPSVQKALAFLSRAQNLKSVNPAAWAGDDGGFVYTPANGGESMGSEAAGEGRSGEKIAAGQPRSLRSYGSMTYAGFKSLIYAGLSRDDVRVRAAFDWVRKNFTFDENPGLGQQGLYYYYHAMARALRVAQQDRITDAEGASHNWREELIDALVERQRADGSWKNGAADRWLEGEPALATASALLALEEAIKPAPIAE